MSSIFMYHAVGSGNEIADADPYYAVTKESFASQLKLIKNSIPLASQLEEKGFIFENSITFDDGHLSNYTIAFPILKELGLTAEFYINTAFVGKDNYMTWAQLSEMTAAGMSIQSHGHHHYYFSDLSNQEIIDELSTSKTTIEKKLNNKVTVFAPPGGRFDNRVIRIAKQLGYLCIATSIPGTVTNGSRFIQPRFAVLANTSDLIVEAWKHRYSVICLKEKLRYRIFKMAKIILGNRLYDVVRARIVSNSEAK